VEIHKTDSHIPTTPHQRELTRERRFIEGDERLITRSDAEIRRRDAGIHSPSASVTRETVRATAVHPLDAPHLLTSALRVLRG